jgi:soluble lytic murein transglycosylase
MPRFPRVAAAWRPALLFPVLLLSAPSVRADGPGDLDPEAARRVVDAHAAARAGRADAARREYLEAAARVPDAGDWLLLRAAVLSVDSAERAGIYARLLTPVARARVTQVEARARERLADYAGAALRYDSAGLDADAFRVRLEAADAAGRERLRTPMLEFATTDPIGPQRRATLALLVRTYSSLTPAEALKVARAAARSQQHSIAASTFATARKAGLLTSSDRLAWGRSLAALGRHRDAVAQFQTVTEPASAAAQARYLTGRSLLRAGDRRAAIGAWWGLVERYPASTASTAPAMFLLGDLAWSDGDAAEARRIWVDLVRRFPKTPEAPRAAFQAALVAWSTGDPGSAAREWDALVSRWPDADPAPGARYWAGRAWARLGNQPRATERWRAVAERDTLGYYAVLSARRLGTTPWMPAPAPDRFDRFGDVDSASARLAALAALEMDDEQTWERDWLVARADGSAERLLAIAATFRDQGEAARAMRLARRALTEGAAPDARTYRLIYPATHLDVVHAAATDAGLEPVLVASLIRQESLWEPKALSPAGARGLMQVMPATGRELARNAGLVGFDADQLFDPATNVRLGVRHLASQIRRFDGDVVRTLAAYNAGGTPVRRWVQQAGTADPELFTERIGYAETRDYVRVIQRNVEIYRALYDWAS